MILCTPYVIIMSLAYNTWHVLHLFKLCNTYKSFRHNLLFCRLCCILSRCCRKYFYLSRHLSQKYEIAGLRENVDEVSLRTVTLNFQFLCSLSCRTLYCAKGNYEFGISRVIKSLEPYQKKLGTDTWFYAKRCFLSLIENMAKHMIMIRDSVLQECVQFLECCESKYNYPEL